MKELKIWFAGSKATDGMLYYCVKNGDMTKEIWETHHKHIFTRAGKYDNKHGVGILVDKKWKQRTIDTEYINERAISATIVVNRQRIKLMSVSMLNWDLDTEMNVIVWVVTPSMRETKEVTV